MTRYVSAERRGELDQAEDLIRLLRRLEYAQENIREGSNASRRIESATCYVRGAIDDLVRGQSTTESAT